MIAVIGWIDFFSGTELRVFPLYYAPISLLAWNVGPLGALLAAGLSALAWLGVNAYAGLQYSSSGIWVANTLLLAGSFAIVGLLISTLKGALVRERALSRTDPLTGLLNRRALDEEGSRLLALCRRKNHPVAMAYLDLDGFKAVNDTSGHEVGDAVLVEVATCIRRAVRPSDITGRYGGDEFIAGIIEGDETAASLVAERIRGAVVEAFAATPAIATLSLGVALRRPAEELAVLISRADAAMYDAKRGGRNRSVVNP